MNSRIQYENPINASNQVEGMGEPSFTNLHCTAFPGFYLFLLSVPGTVSI